MENIICSLLGSTTTKDFLSTLNRYGECIDYSSDYERSKTKEAIFAGVVNKVYELIPKGKGGHPEHDTLFISARCLINTRRESQPFRIGFFGDVVRQLADVKLKPGDAIAILKPKFFYAMDVPSLNAGVASNVLWIGKNIKDSQTSMVSSSEVPDFRSISEDTNHTNVNARKRKNVSVDDSHLNSEASSIMTIGTIQRNVQILRSKPVELIPDSTTKSVAQNKRTKKSPQNRIDHEIIENIISQNTANAGSVDIPVRNDKCNDHYPNCNLLSKPQNHEEMHLSHHNCANVSCGNQNCRTTSCEPNCCKLYEPPNFSCCNCQTSSRNHMLQDCSCGSRIPGKLIPKQHCSCNITTSCFGNDRTHQRSCCNSVQACHRGCCFANRHCDQSHRRIMRLCPNATHSHHHCHNLDCRNTCSTSNNHCQRQNRCEKISCNTLLHNCHQRHFLNYCCSDHKQTKCTEETRQSSCCDHVVNSNAPMHSSKQCHSNEEMNTCAEELSCRISRTKEWVHNWEQKLPSPQLPQLDITDTTFQNPPSCSEFEQTISRLNRGFDVAERQKNAETIVPCVLSSSDTCSVVNYNKKQFTKKTKLFTPVDNSTVISEKSVYNHSTIIEESTPFSTESQSDNVPSSIAAFEKNIENYAPRQNHSHLSILSLENNSINPSGSRSKGQTEIKENEVTTNVGTSKVIIIDSIKNISEKAVLNNDQADKSKNSGQEVNKNSSEEAVLNRDQPHKNKHSKQEINKNLSGKGALIKDQSNQNKHPGQEINRNLSEEAVLNKDQPDQNKDSEQEINTNLSEEAVLNKDQPDQNKDSGEEINKNLSEEAVLNKDLPDQTIDPGQEINRLLLEEAVLNKDQPDHNNDSEQEINTNLSEETVLNKNLPDQTIDSGQEINRLLPEEAVLIKDQPSQNKDSGQELNKQLSEEQFPELQIDTPIVSQATSIDLPTDRNTVIRYLDDERTFSDEITDEVNVLETPVYRKNIVSHKSIDDETCTNEKATNINTKSGNDENNLKLCPNLVEEPKSGDIVTIENDIHEISTVNKKSDKSNYSCLSLSLSDHSRSKIKCLDDNVTAEMDLTDIPNNIIEKSPLRRRPVECLEDEDDLMELTCESKLMKRRRTSPNKILNPGSPKSDKNINSSTSVSSSGTFFDALDSNSQIINKWCLKTIDDVFGREEYSVPATDLVKLGLTHSDSYNFTLFSTFKIVGAIINIPHLSSDNYGGIIYGYCNEGCRKKFSYKDYCVTDLQKDYICSFCKYRYHHTCPECLKKGITQPLCLAFYFEIHLVDGKNVLRIEVDNKEAVNLIGATPQYYLKSDKTFQKIRKIMISSLPDKWTNTVLLKAGIKVLSKSGVPTMTIQNTSFKNDLTLNGKRYKF